MAIKPQFRKLLDGCHEMELSHLRPLVDRMFENADVALLDFAEKAESNVAQSLFFEAMNEVRKKRSSIEKHFYAEIQRGFDEFPTCPETSAPLSEAESGLASLSLVETDAVETTVATQNAAGKLASRIMEKIFALKQRLAIVNEGNSVQENQIPGGPAWLGAAFQHAIDELDLENKVRLVFIALFDKYVLGKVDTLFNEYNDRLIDAGILPNLRYEVLKQPGGVEIVEKTVAGNQDEAESSVPASTNEDPHVEQTPSELGDELFGRICDLMACRRGGSGAGQASAGNVSAIGSGTGTGGGSGGGSAAGSAGGGMAASGGGSVLVGHINKLQTQVQAGTAVLSSSEFIENIEIDQQLIDRLQDTLAEEREKIFGAVDRRKLPAADTNVIELVGMMFEYMLKEEALPNVVKALLSRLHTPLLKVAVIDNSFFTDSQHSARKLLNDMTAAGIRWVEENQIDRGIFPKMKELVDKVLMDFKENVEVFDKLLEEFDQAVGELDNRANLVEQRTTEAANGQEKLQMARSRAQKEIQSLSGEKPVEEAAREFLKRIWADKLTFILLRAPEADQSEEWHLASKLAARIIDASIPPEVDEQRAQRKAGLPGLQEEIREASKSLQQADKEKLIGALFEAQHRVLDAEFVTAAEPGQDPGPNVVENEPQMEAEEEAQVLSPEQEAMLEKLKSIPFGTWFNFHKTGKPTSRAKLSWRSTVTEKFMFVDQMGVKAAVISMHELADCMISGKVSIVSEDKKPFVDRALNAIHRMLDHAA